MTISEPLVRALPYRRDPLALLAAVRDLPWPALLDSGRPAARGGRYDLIVADPVLRLETRGDTTTITDRAGRVTASDADPLALLAAYLGPPGETIEGLPFSGGALGWFGYDLARRFERLPASARDDEGLPQMAVGLYDWALVVDHDAERVWLVGQGRDPRTARLWPRLISRLERPPPAAIGTYRATGPVRSHLERTGYAERIERILRYIRDGDCYQVNFAQRFSVPYAGDPLAIYRRLRALNPAPFGGYLEGGGVAILSSSPERFLRVRNGLVETRPIKGTRPRSDDPNADRANREVLRESAKDRAENLMIVDLLRNDLGRACATGSVRAERLFEVESFATVHHLVSTITGRLAPRRSALDLLRAAFPGGSITGAPKLRAMEIIEELEGLRRGVYCGALGYVGYDGAMDTNIAIRTLVASGGTARFWSGGGIVADSHAEAEYAETLVKAAALRALFEG